MAEQPIYQCGLASNRYRLYQNRLEIDQKPFFFGGKEVVKLKDITAVSHQPGERIEIRTVKGRMITLNIVGKPANELADKLAELLEAREDHT